MLGAGVALGPVARAADTGPVPRRVFFDNPDVRNLQISPDGSQLAWLAPIGGARNLWVAPVGAPRAARPITRVTGRSLGDRYSWAHNNRQLIFFRDHEGDENFGAASVDVNTEVVTPLTPERGVRSAVQELDHHFPDEALLRHNARDKRYFDIYRVNLKTGASTLVFENREFAWLITDAQFQIRLGGRYRRDGTLDVLEHRRDGSWDPFIEIPIGDIDGTDLIDFNAEGDTLHMLDPRGRDKAALVGIDMATRRATVLAEDATGDIDKVAFDPLSRRPIAARATPDRARWQALDAATRDDLARLAAFGPGDVEFTSRSLDGKLATVYFERDTSSGVYALLDRTAGQVTPLFVQRPALSRVALRPMEPVMIPARDGLMLPGYLTQPAHPAGGGKPPLVLVIHGGPYWRDWWGFNGTHQWLADRGYAALSVNYRGSTGFGKAFVTAADREWGGRMHDDLIDARDWALARGVGDPQRVGFYGASYGGYSALNAATLTPDRFACIVDIFGVSNLKTFMATIPPYWGPWFSIWKNRLADPDTEAGRAFLEARSPLTHIERATKPILIAQGMNDVRVVAAESEQMVAALQRRGVPVTYVTFSD
ncbi:MAG: S9 family peptidase, partial [Alphaproteobacteria bacterium]|nr:S9 family peptidase [Alphaproteobacteria bacterium]